MIEDKLKKLKEHISSLESAVVAFSGGVDSAVLTAVAYEVLGDKMIAVTGDSASVPSRDRESALSFCKKRGIPHLLIRTKEFDNEAFADNPENRCFYCKKELFERLTDTAAEKGFNYVIEGTNASELLGHRPGFRAARGSAVVATPYVDAGITKEEVREIARKLGLEVAERPSTACLASRIPFGTRIEGNILRRIDEAENFLLSLGLRQVRLRHHGDTARIETDDGGIGICLERRSEIAERIKSLGWKKVTLDLEGYRTGGGM